MLPIDNITIAAQNDTVVNAKGDSLVSIKAKDEIRDKKILHEMFNNHYIIIVENSSGSTPKSTRNPSNPVHDKWKMQDISQYYRNYPSIMKVKENLIKLLILVNLLYRISLIIKFLNPRKATVPDFFLLKFIQFGSNVIDSHPCNIIKEKHKSKS